MKLSTQYFQWREMCCQAHSWETHCFFFGGRTFGPKVDQVQALHQAEQALLAYAETQLLVCV